MGSLKDLIVYIKAYDLAMELFHITKSFPEHEKYGLVSQVRRSSRSVCSNIAEGYRKRLYRAHFKSKLTDADMENTETGVWIDFAKSCGYINEDKRSHLSRKADEIGRLLSFMMDNPDRFIGNLNNKVKQ